ncbi:MAG TPA: DNA methyltransferase [Candidatus Acidoferrales bacterium]|nr:DNA methyltransferase [Candidatus Acidoferrales bacterium]
MNAVEIEEAISKLAEQPFDAAEFPFAFLVAFANKETTIKRLRTRDGNYSDRGGVLQRNNAHIAVFPNGDVGKGLAELKASPATAKHKARFAIATDGEWFEAEDLDSGETVACAYSNFPNHFGFFLPLAGISTVRQVRENSFDIRATSRLNRLYIELLKENPDWGTTARRQDMNHFMARLIFCFFAENTGIFNEGLFTYTVEQMSTKDSSNAHEVISTLFRAMDTKREDHGSAGIPRWADSFPYVNGGLFAGDPQVPRFTRAARSYLLHVGKLDWTQINPDIFGSMIQAVADDEERGALGMHYTSRPNILKVLNPLFLDDLRERLREAGDNARKLLNLRSRITRIRVFDPACGSGNFLVIAYKEMREIEAEINRRRGEPEQKSRVPLTNFRGIETRGFAAEIARLSLIIAEFQCDVLYRGKQLALAEFLPLQKENWIVQGNALRLDWLSVCPPAGSGVRLRGDDLFATPLGQTEIDFENEGGETYICGNPPYQGAREQSPEQKEDLRLVFDKRIRSWKSLDYVTAWFLKAADYGQSTNTTSAFVATNSVCQGQHVPILWPHILGAGNEIAFAHTSFKWSNLASHNAGVSVVVVGISTHAPTIRRLFSVSDDGVSIVKETENINPYLAAGPNIIVSKRSHPLSGIAEMNYGNYPGDGTHLTLSALEASEFIKRRPDLKSIIRPVYGAREFINGLSRFCLWIDDTDLEAARSDVHVLAKIEAVRQHRLKSDDVSLNKLARRPHQYRDRNVARHHLILAPTVSSEQREYIPPDLKSANSVTTNQAFALYDAPLWNLALIASRMHLVWIATVCGKHESRYRYSNTLGWNTFPLPTLTDKMKADLTRSAEDILLAREAHFPATIADLYDAESMPANLRSAHERNDEVLERIYIGRRFKNDTERLEKLFELYLKLDANRSQQGGA